MSTGTTTQSTTTTFTRTERRALRAVRARFQDNYDLFSAHELARLRFLRWFHHSGIEGRRRALDVADEPRR